MTESSRFWDGTTIGDATQAPYDAGTEFSEVMMLVSATAEMVNKGGVYNGYLNSLSMAGISSPLNLNSGGAIVYGTWYRNDATLPVSIPTPAALTRIDRLVIRKNWATQTARLTRVPGAEGGGEPVMTQTAGVIWDIPLYKVTVTTGGAITLVDERDLLPNVQQNYPPPNGQTVTGMTINASTINNPTINNGISNNEILVDASLQDPLLRAPNFTAPAFGPGMIPGDMIMSDIESHQLNLSLFEYGIPATVINTSTPVTLINQVITIPVGVNMVEIELSFAGDFTVSDAFGHNLNLILSFFPASGVGPQIQMPISVSGNKRDSRHAMRRMVINQFGGNGTLVLTGNVDSSNLSVAPVADIRWSRVSLLCL